MIKVTVWNEFHHERNLDRVKELYPNGIHAVIAEFLKCSDISVRTATLDQPECGLTQDVIDDTDVLIWWGHAKHDWFRTKSSSGCATPLSIAVWE